MPFRLLLVFGFKMENVSGLRECVGSNDSFKLSLKPPLKKIEEEEEKGKPKATFW